MTRMLTHTKDALWILGMLAACEGPSSLDRATLSSGPEEESTLNDPEGPALANPEDPALPGQDDAERKKDEIANPFTMAAHDPLSTFGADVDSASYDVFRQSVSDGTVPPPKQVRIEDFVNFFDYDYPTPKAGAEQPFAISLAVAPHPMGRDTMLLRVGIQAEAPPADTKKAANVVFLVDVSGSMGDPLKLPLVKVVLARALDVLDEEDKVSIVTYSGETSVRLPPTEVTHRDLITAQIEAMQASGGTNGASGISLAYAQAQAAFIEGGINHVVLCTDGDFNLGLTSDDELLNLIRSQRQTGITLTALGFGRGDLNDAMMEKVSNAGNGMYAVVYSQDQAVDYAHDRLLSTLVHVAKDMKLQVEMNPAHVRAYRLLGYEDRAIADDDFRQDRVDGGEVGAGHRVTALYELVLPGDPVPTPEGAPDIASGKQTTRASDLTKAELLRVSVRYKRVEATDADPAFEVSQSLAPSALKHNGAGDDDLRWAAAVATIAELLRKSPYARESELDLAQAIVDEQAKRDADRGELSALLSQMRMAATR